jgi:hypothetical protein
MKTAKAKRTYVAPKIEKISIDNEISLILNSLPEDPWARDMPPFERDGPFKMGNR